MVRIQDLSLAFNGQTLFEHLNLTLLPNEWVSLLGSSGVGKSTLLRLLAGIETQGVVQGKILFEPKIRIAWLPQKETLYPWLSIVDNVQLQAVLFGRKSAKTTEKAKMLLEKVGMAAHWHKPCCSRPRILRNITVKSEKSEILAISHFKRLKIAKFEK